MKFGAELRDYRKEERSFKLRIAIGLVFILGLFSVLVARFVYLQVVQYEHYHALAESNRISVVPIVPNRGLILDRNGIVLAHNFSAYTLELIPSKLKDVDTIIDGLAQLIEITPRDRRRFKKELAESRNFESLPIRTRLTDVEVARFAAHQYRFPGVEIKARLFRHYPHTELASHVTGYIGRINDADLKELIKAGVHSNYKGSEHIGKIGIEQSYEKELHGVTGFAHVETDAGGRAVRSLSRALPISGDNLVLTLDARLQEVAYQAFGKLRGALVAIDPANGEILAFISKPGFDPNLFVDGIDHANWEMLNTSLDKPLNNRALRGQYPPGSTFKPFMALAGIELGERKPSDTIQDPGYFSLPGSAHRYRDWKPGGHGLVDLHKSLVISCDTYYYRLAYDMGIEALHGYIGRFGFGSPTGIDIGGEVGGLLPSEAWKARRFKQPWYPGETVITGIGQGYVLATPLQLAHATAILANEGKSIRPHFLRAVQESKSGVTVARALSPHIPLSISQESLELVRAAMIDVTRPGGTAAQAGKDSPYAIAGKTGTAQVIGQKQGERYVESRTPERLRDHALFIAYAPAEDPKIALAVIAENGGHGGSTAAPIARQVMDYYLLGKKPVVKPATGETPGPHD